ncbi:uncharacterized protein [Pyrus communis]|uniref:uncharacterized protein n=1 Tax=Pyrus communis TaxID=23211 RepID=UPI0035C1578E
MFSKGGFLPFRGSLVDWLALIKTHRSNAETYHGEALCKQKFHELLKELSLPKGFIRADIEEMGHHQPSGFVWLKQKKTTHKFKSIGKTVSYDDELTMLVEKGRITKLTGVASKEVFVWISVCEIYFDDLSSDKLTFEVPASLTATFPALAFKDKDEKDDGVQSPSVQQQLKAARLRKKQYIGKLTSFHEMDAISIASRCTIPFNS